MPSVNPEILSWARETAGLSPLKDNSVYQAVAKRRYVRVPRIVSITRPEEVLGFGASDFSPETIEQRANEGYKQTDQALRNSDSD